MTNMSTKQIYRIIGTDKTVSKKINASSVETEVIYDNRKPLYTSNDLDDAVKTFEKLCKEDYMEHMLLIVDFGMMPLKERVHQALCKTNGGTKYNEMVPYVTVLSYHRDDGYGMCWNAPTVSITMGNGNVERHFKDMVDALRFFSVRLYDRGNMKMEITEHCSDVSGKKYDRTRALVNSKEFKCTDSYYPCHKIRIIEDRYLSKYADNNNVISINNVAC